MRTHLILGAGLIGTALADTLVARGDTVRVASRSGTRLPGAHSAIADAADAPAIAELARDADTIFVCTNPPYPDWADAWPPVFAAAGAAARDTGARLVLMGNLYAHGRVSGSMTAQDPPRPVESKGRIRQAGWESLKAAHDRGDIRAAEVRASDYFGPGAGPTAHLGRRFFAPLLGGKTAWCVGDPTQPHAWSYIPDIATTLVAVADATDDHFGRPWLVPSHARSQQEIAREVSALAGATGRVRGVPPIALRGLGLVSPQMREVERVSYQFNSPFTVDARDSERDLGVRATPWASAIATTVAAYAAEAARGSRRSEGR